MTDIVESQSESLHNALVASFDEFTDPTTEIERLRKHAEELAGAAIQDIAAERRRQIEAEKWTPEHDDFHTAGELGLAAALYALPYEAEIGGVKLLTQDDFIRLDMLLELTFGWALKPEPDRRRRLVKAGALIAAEIERMDRAEYPEEK